MGREKPTPFRRILRALEDRGLLLLTDPLLPSVATLVAGEPVRGSWWGHPKAHTIFRVAGELAGHPDVLLARFVSGKMTYVHRRLWPGFLALAASGEPWQTRGLSRPSRALLLRVRRAGQLRPDRLGEPGPSASPTAGGLIRDLEDRLLIHTEAIHTESGFHAKVLESWDHWAGRRGASRQGEEADRARARFEEILAGLNREYGSRARLPWMKACAGS